MLNSLIVSITPCLLVTQMTSIHT